jgi:hypothetical protein
MAWEPLPSEIADWMGMDTDMLRFAVDLAAPVEGCPQLYADVHAQHECAH